jgi:hypothetical protein
MIQRFASGGRDSPTWLSPVGLRVCSVCMWTFPSLAPRGARLLFGIDGVCVAGDETVREDRRSVRGRAVLCAKSLRRSGETIL